MLLGGDELARTQHGNNNAYCQDNELSWFDWELDERGQRLLEFTRRLIAFRARAPGLPARGLPHRRGAARVGLAGRLVVPAGRAQDDAAELATAATR